MITLTLLQEAVLPDVWGAVLDVGGVVGMLLAIAVVVLWRKNEAKDAMLAQLNEQIKTDAKEFIRVIGSMEHLIDRLIAEHGAGEKRIIDAVRNEAHALKDYLNVVKNHVKEKTDRGGA